jgi:ABC-2 type transport system permease protein
MIDRVRTVIEKEWAEVFKNRMVLWTVLLLPLLLTALPIIMLIGMRDIATSGTTGDLPPGFLEACGGLAAGECFQVYLLNIFLLMFMMMPLAIPVAIAAYSIVGEKTTRSLEPLLATPLRTEELLAAKSLAAVLPAVLATWLGFAIFLLAVPLVTSPNVVRVMAGPVWLLAVLVIGPLLAVLAVNFALIVSSRVSDPRVAEQVSMVIIVPLLGFMFGQIAGVLVMSVKLMLISAVILTAVDAALIYAGARMFQREAILTKWK